MSRRSDAYASLYGHGSVIVCGLAWMRWGRWGRWWAVPLAFAGFTVLWLFGFVLLVVAVTVHEEFMTVRNTQKPLGNGLSREEQRKIAEQRVEIARKLAAQHPNDLTYKAALASRERELRELGG